MPSENRNEVTENAGRFVSPQGDPNTRHHCKHRASCLSRFVNAPRCLIEQVHAIGPYSERCRIDSILDESTGHLHNS